MTDIDSSTKNSLYLVIGAGMAGLTAAAELQRSGRQVLVVDKGHGVGGRMANRRIGTAAFDHGAQFMTARDARFAAAMDQWRASGIVEEWFHGSAAGHSRWRGKPAMTAIPKYIASNLNLRLETRVICLTRSQANWTAVLENGETIQAGAVILTPPVPQSLALLDAGGFELPAEARGRLEKIDYERCITVMVMLNTPPNIAQPGGTAPAEGPIAWLADNQMKGISATPAVTIHATPAYSLEHWDRDRQESARDLLHAAAPWLGAAQVTGFQVHAWRFSRPVGGEENRCLILNLSPRLIIAGDAFGGPRVEGAALSGWAAADALKQVNPPLGSG